MKLHLPKCLLTAVLAVCVAPATWADTVTVTSDAAIGDVYVSGTTTRIEVTGGTLSFGTTNNVTLTEGLLISGGTVTAGTNNGNGFVSNQTDVTINGGGVLRLTEKDSIGYDTGATKSVTLKGSEGNLAYMELAARQTMTTNIVMEGYSEIKNAAGANTTGGDWASLATWDGGITVRGTHNTISSGIDLRKNVTISIEKNGELTLNGKIAPANGFNPTMTVSGEGVVNFGGNVALEGVKMLTVTSGIAGNVRTLNSNLTLGDGTTAVSSTVERLELCDWNDSTSNVTIKDKYTLKISGNNNTDFSYGALVLAEWGTNSHGNLNVEGTLLAESACALMAEGYATIDIKGTGSVAILGIKDKNNSTHAHVAIAEGGKLVLGAEGIQSTAGTFTSSIAGTIGISANTVAINRDLTIAGDTAVLDTTQYGINGYELTQGTTGGTLALNGDLLGSGKVTVVGAGTLQVGDISSAVDVDVNCSAMDFLGTLQLGAGKTLALDSGVTVTVSATDMSGFTRAGGFLDVNGSVSSDGNGFATGSYALVAGGTITGEVTVSYEGKNYTVNNDNRAFGESLGTDYTTYYANSGSATVSEIAACAQEQSVTVSDYYVAAGATLNVDTVPTAPITVTGDATLNISKGVSLNQTSVERVEGAKTTLAGEGGYTISQATLHAANGATSSPAGILIGDNWKGQVDLLATGNSNNLSVQWLNLNHYGNANSTIKLRGVAGYLCAANSGTAVEFASDLIMENTNMAALELTDGCSNDHFIFSGDIKNGTNGGNLVKASKVQQNITFTGNISNWTGIIDLTSGEQKDGRISTIAFKGNATTVNNEIRTRDKENSDQIVKAAIRFENDKAVTMNGAIKDNATRNGSMLNLEVATAKGTTFNGEVTLKGSTRVENGSKAIFTKGLTTETLTLGESSLLVANSVSHSVLNAGAGSALIKTSVTPTDLSNITVTESITLQAGGSTAGLGTSLVLTDGAAININGEGSVVLGGALTLGSNLTLNEAVLSNIAALTEENSSLVLFTSVTALNRYDASGIALLSTNSTAIDASEIFAGFEAETYQVDLIDGNLSIGIYTIPEPTTATLSLLALAALAARRRRK